MKYSDKDPAALVDHIRHAFPDLKWDAYTFIDVGWDHKVIQLDDKYIFRFPNSPEYVAMLHDEVNLLAYLEKHLKTRIPHYSHIAPDFSFAGYAMLPGQELSLGRFKNFSDVQKQVAAKNIADFLSDLHSVDVAELSAFHVGIEPDFAGYSGVAAEAEKYLKPILSSHEYSVITDMLQDIAKVQKYPQPARLIHDDMAPKHIIWDADTETLGFIDFSDRVISDPAYDFAELYTYGESFVDMVYDFYHGPDKSDQFLARAKAYMKAIGVHVYAKNTYRAKKIPDAEVMKLLNIAGHLRI